VSKKQTVLSLYQAYGRGDLDAVMRLLADDVEWNNHLGAARPGGHPKHMAVAPTAVPVTPSPSRR